MTKTALRSMLMGPPGWVNRGASLDLDLANGRAFCNGSVVPIESLVSCTRASTGYATNKAGVLIPFAANTLRNISDGTGSFIEEARTNLALRSQTFANATWSKSQINEAASAVNAPDGTATASTITTTAGGSVHDLFQALSAISGTYSESVWMRAGTSNFGFINLQSGANYLTVVVNLATGAVTQTAAAGTASLTSSSITAYTNGWYRVNLTGSLGSAVAYICVGVAGAATGNTFNAGGEVVFGSAAGTENIHLWGFQLELGAFPTSYIPTTTTSVTRAADISTLIGPASAAAADSKAAYFETNLAVFGNSAPRLFESSVGVISFGNTTQVAISASGQAIQAVLGSGSITGVVKSAFGFDATSMTAVANGGNKATTANPWSGVAPFYLASNAGTIRQLNGYMRRAVFGPTKGQFDAITIGT